MSLHMLLVGASGSGKSSILKEAAKKLSFRSTVSCTTRLPRAGEVNGQHYHFLSREDFQKKIADDLFVEYATFGSNLYGTLESDLQTLLASGEPVIYDIEVQGAKQTRIKFPNVIVVFVIPPSIDDLRKRILADETRNHTEAELDARLARAREEIKEAYSLADFVLVNERLDHAVEHLIGLVGYYEKKLAEWIRPDFSGRNRYSLDKCLAAQ